MDKKTQKQVLKGLSDVCIGLAQYSKDKKQKKEFERRSIIFKNLAKLIK